ncbi:MAG: cbb3-type cytochrome c oxidase subunit 3 [Gammaproteobacteria bacterium]|nr:cbb3-type cytochrome c oxidase subunit 3 [Gammaproteobacteria bacterium]
MTATIISLLAVTLAFGGLLIWVFWPGNRQRFEDYGRIPFGEKADDDANTKRIPNR